MDLKTYISSERGRSAVLAERIGVSPSYLSQLASGLSPTSPERCVEIEVATDGLVSRKDLRPNDWQRIWPELAQQLTPEDIAEAEAKRNGGIRMSGDTRDAKNIGE